MHSNNKSARQQQQIQEYVKNSDSYRFFNLLTGPELLSSVETLLPEHRERLYPPTETLSMFLSQTLSEDRSCQKIKGDATRLSKFIDISTISPSQFLANK